MSAELDKLISELKAKRGSGKDWFDKEIILLKFISLLGDKDRFIAKGEYRYKDYHAPAILTYSAETRELHNWTVLKDTDYVVSKDVHYFWSNIPYIGIVKEVLDTQSSSVTII